MSRCEPGKLDLDLDEEVSRDALADCLASGWTAAEIAEELGLEGADDVARWCAYHDLPAPRVAESLPPPPAPAVKVKKEASKQPVNPRRKVVDKGARPKHTRRGKDGRYKAGRKEAKARPQIADEDVVRCYDRCHTLKATGRELGISPYYVEIALKRCGMEQDRERACWAQAHLGREAQAPRGISLERRSEMLAAAHAALAALHATPQEIESIINAPMGELLWAMRHQTKKAQETP